MFISLLKRKKLNFWYIVADVFLTHVFVVMILFFVTFNKQSSLIHINAQPHHYILMPYRTAKHLQEKQKAAPGTPRKPLKQEKKKNEIVTKKKIKAPAPKKQLPQPTKKKKALPKLEKKPPQQPPQKAAPPPKIEHKEIPQEIPLPEKTLVQEIEEPLIITGNQQPLATADGFIRNQIMQQWHPPQGFGNLYCRFKITLSKEGAPTSIDLETSSGVPAYDIAARTALINIEYPREKWSSTITIAFGELPS